MTESESLSLFWCAIFGGAYLLAFLSAVRMKQDEKPREEKES